MNHKQNTSRKSRKQCFGCSNAQKKKSLYHTTLDGSRFCTARYSGKNIRSSTWLKIPSEKSHQIKIKTKQLKFNQNVQQSLLWKITWFQYLFTEQEASGVAYTITRAYLVVICILMHAVVCARLGPWARPPRPWRGWAKWDLAQNNKRLTAPYGTPFYYLIQNWWYVISVIAEYCVRTKCDGLNAPGQNATSYSNNAFSQVGLFAQSISIQSIT